MNNSDDFSHFASSMVLKPKEALKSPGGLLKSQIARYYPQDSD